MKPYLKFLFEVVAIVVGITLSFMVDEWREDRQNREHTLRSLKEIRGDLIEDTNRINHVISYNNSLAEKAVLLQKPPQKNLDLKQRQSLYGFGPVVFNIRGSSYSRFINNNEEPVIKNDSIIRMLGSYYHIDWLQSQNLEYRETAFDLNKNHFRTIPHLYENELTKEQEIEQLKFLNDLHNSTTFINDINFYLNHLNVINRIYDSYLQAANNLLEAIDKELNLKIE